MNVPFIDFKAQYKENKKDIDRAISRVLSGGYFILGHEVEEFEKEFAHYIEVSNCATVNSGTDALTLGIQALNLASGDEIILPTNTFIATALAISQNRLKPVPVDIDEKDYGINLDDLQKKITRKTKAIIIVHLYGMAEKIDEIQEVIKKSGKNIYLIEDACQAHGATYKGKKVGSFGEFAAFSFYPTKNLGTYGDGGAITTQNLQLAKKVKQMREYGQKEKYVYEIKGVNSRLDTIQAAILRAKLPKLNEWNKKRQQLSKQYTTLLKSKAPHIIMPYEDLNRPSVSYVYPIRVKNRDAFTAYLKEKGVATVIHYPVPIHLQESFAELRYRKGDFPIAEKVASQIVSLPLYPEMSEKSVEYVVDMIASYA